jgi:hypothetical protein
MAADWVSNVIRKCGSIEAQPLEGHHEPQWYSSKIDFARSTRRLKPELILGVLMASLQVMP